MTSKIRLSIVATLLSLFVAMPVLAQSPLKLNEGESVAYIGNTMADRMQHHAWLETYLHALHPKHELVFRNLGWSGDNVWGHSRAVFNTPDKGFERLIRDLKLADPTLILMHYLRSLRVPTRL